MKRIFTFISLFLLAFVVGGLIVQALPAPKEEEATLVVHFHKWDDNYEMVGGHAWGGKVLVEVGEEFVDLDDGVQPTGKDDFGIYFTYRYTASETAADIGFIPVKASVWNEDGTIVQDWDSKYSSEDVIIPVAGNEAGSETHVYVFQGSKGKDADEEAGEVPFLVADPEMVNMLLVFFDPEGKYHEDLGVHSWGWKEGQDALGWNTPYKPFKTVGKIGSSNVKAAIFNQTAESIKGAGLLIYHGDDDNSKYTGDLKEEVIPDLPIYADGVENGLVVPVYVVNAGAGTTSNKNVFYGEKLNEFGVEATTFRFDLGSYQSGAGTFAFNKNTVYTMFNQAIPTNFTTLDEEQKAAVKTDLMTKFIISEKVEGQPSDKVVAISDIHFNEFADEAKEFILTLATDLDSTKEYVIEYKEVVEQPVERTVKFKTTAPEGTESVYIVGAMNGWTPGTANWKMTKAADGTFTYEFTKSLLQKEIEYKYVYARSVEEDGWKFAETIEGNRKLVIGEEAEINVTDTIAAWGAVPAGADEIAEEQPAIELPNDAAPEAKYAVADLEVDNEAPELIFLSDMKEEDGNYIVEIQAYTKWDASLFPRYTVNDKRDGNLTHRVYVPVDTEFKILDTNELGDQKILLRVEDNWGHVTEVIFIFRVAVKKWGRE